MNRRLIVMRHAKSSWDSGAPTDHARPLARRGQKAAPQVAEAIDSRGWSPEHVLSSDSARTRQTWERMSRRFGDEVTVDFRRLLYHAGIFELAEALAAVPDDVATVLALGHNPGWQEVVATLCGEAVVLQTGDAALLETRAVTWQQALVRRPSWTLHDIIRAKEQ